MRVRLAPCKEIQDCLGFWITPHGFQVLTCRFFISVTWNRISIVDGITNFLSCIPDSKAKPVDMPLMLPFHDTRFWYHALIGQLSQSWQIPMLLTGEMSRSFNSGKRCVLKDFEQAIQILSTTVTWKKKIELKTDIQKAQHYNHAPTKGMMNTKNWRLSYPFHCLAPCPLPICFYAGTLSPCHISQATRNLSTA